jgi:hypothetical protein
VSGRTLKDSPATQRKRTASEQTPRRIVAAEEEEDRREQKEKEQGSKGRRGKERKKEKKQRKEELKAARMKKDGKPASIEPVKGKEETREVQDSKFDAVVAGGAGWKEHLQNLWEEDFETSFRSATTLADSSPFTSPNSRSVGSITGSSEGKLASAWALEALRASPTNERRQLASSAEYFHSSMLVSCACVCVCYTAAQYHQSVLIFTFQCGVIIGTARTKRDA